MGYSYDASCKNVYKKDMIRTGVIAPFCPNDRRSMVQCGRIRQQGRPDCVWVPYSPCPYGSKDVAKDISPNLIGRCEKLVEAVDDVGQNIAWTNRLDQKSFQYVSPYGYIYAGPQNNAPYGSIIVYGEGDQPPENWQTTFGKDFITMGGQVRSGTCSAGETCKSNGRCDPSGNPCDTTITKHDPTTNKYPLWIIPKSEDVKRCDNDPSKPCTDNSQCGGGNCIADEAMACVLSSGGSPAACTDPYCYNDAPNPAQSSSQCSAGSADQSFEMNIPQLVRPNTPSAAQKSKNNKDNYAQGAERLRHLFAKSYGMWAWNDQSSCVPVSQDNFVPACNISGTNALMIRTVHQANHVL